MSGAPMSPAQLRAMARRFRVLAEPARLVVLQALRTGPLHVTGLIDRTGLRQANLSKHLGVLHAHGMVARSRRGRFVEYGIADAAVIALCDVMCGQLPPARRQAPRAARRRTEPDRRTAAIASPAARLGRAE